jgi:hypothetical protein
LVEEQELDEFISGQLQKDITQADSIDPSVEQHLQEMGFLFDTVHKKLENEKVCFSCKKEFKEKEVLFLMEANVKEKGMVAFVSICSSCKNKLETKKE